MKRRAFRGSSPITAVVFFGVFTLGPWAVPGALATGSAATCSLDITLHLTPGLTLKSGSGTISSGEAAGSLNCVGFIAGQLVTGPGQFRVAGTYGGTVLQGGTSGRASYSVPTVSGPRGGTVNYVVTWLTDAGFITVQDNVYGNGVGPFLYLPNGTGLTGPVTTIRWVSQHIVFGSGAPTGGS